MIYLFLFIVSSVSVVGILPYSQSNLYVANLIKSLSHKSGLFSLGRVVQYIIVNGMEKEVQTCQLTDTLYHTLCYTAYNNYDMCYSVSYCLWYSESGIGIITNFGVMQKKKIQNYFKTLFIHRIVVYQTVALIQ